MKTESIIIISAIGMGVIFGIGVLIGTILNPNIQKLPCRENIQIQEKIIEVKQKTNLTDCLVQINEAENFKRALWNQETKKEKKST